MVNKFKKSLVLGAVLASVVAIPAVAGENVVPAPRIVGGGYTPISNVPWQVFLQREAGGGYYYACGGIVISDNYILTAAHCVDTASYRGGSFIEADPSTITIFAGIEDRKNMIAENGLSVADVTIHPQYDNYFLTADIALLRLSGSIPSTAKPIRMLDSGEQLDLDIEFSNAATENLFVSGWGDESNDADYSTRYLKRTLLDGVADNNCSVTNDDAYICADQSLNTGSCYGDSGGPLVWQDPSKAGNSDRGYRVAGIVSFGVGNNCGVPGDEDVYTQISTYYGWVSSEMGGYTPASVSFAADIFDTSVSYQPEPAESETPVESGGGGGSGGVLSLFGLFVIGTVRRRRKLV